MDHDSKRLRCPQWATGKASSKYAHSIDATSPIIVISPKAIDVRSPHVREQNPEKSEVCADCSQQRSITAASAHRPTATRDLISDILGCDCGS